MKPPPASPPPQRIREIGTEIFERARDAAPSIIRPDFWINRLMEWALAEPLRRFQLFRWIDVLPTLRTDRAVIAHLAEYLLQPGVPLPKPFARMVRNAADGAWYRSRLAAIARQSALQMARRFIAGQTPAEAIATVAALRDRGMGFTIDVLGEATISDSQADWYARQYLDLVNALADAAPRWEANDLLDRAAAGPNPRVNLSIKISSLDPRFDPVHFDASVHAAADRLRPILRLARRRSAFVNIDMEQYKYKDLTLAVFRHVLGEPEFADFADVGIVLQAYLGDAAQDLEALIDWVRRRGTPIACRLVKGAYWDFETAHAIQNGWEIPVLQDKWRSDAQFEAMTRRIFDHRDLIRPALASHNVRSLAAGMAYAETVGAEPHEYEIQMLFGMGDELKTAVADMGYMLRIYAPFGELIPGMAYLIRRLLENSSNESFLRQGFAEERPIEELLADPAEARPPSTPAPQPEFIDTPEDYDMMPFAFEPVSDFAHAHTRVSMTNGLAAVRKQFGRAWPLVIDGKTIDTTERLDSLNPSKTTEIVGHVCKASAEHVELAVIAAGRAFDAWSRTPVKERVALLLKAADLMRGRRFELTAWIVFEVGKPWREADADVAEAIDFCRYYGQLMQRIAEQPRRRDFPGESNLYVYQPRGVAAVIAPWNFPLAILTGMSAAALAAGNTVIMKPAEQSSVVAARLMEIWTEAGFPRGVVNFLPGDGAAVGAALVKHPGVDLIAFTGSRDVGTWIYEEASKLRPGQRGLKRVIAEMGGKNAIIVDADADLDDAVGGVLPSAFDYGGQKCSACSRVIVHRDIVEPFIARLVDAARAVRVGPAEDPETMVGPLVDPAACEKAREYIRIGAGEGREAYSADLGGLHTQGCFVPPTIFTDVKGDARIAREEIFGPVVAVITAEDFDHAIRIANATDYALTGGIYSRSPVHIDRARREFNVGNLYINRKITGALVDRQPFGGFRMSGIGSKAGGPDYLLQFMEPKTITENTLRYGLVPAT